MVDGFSRSSSISWSVLISHRQSRLSYHQVFSGDSQISLIYTSCLATRDSWWFSRYSRTTRYLPVVLGPSRLLLQHRQTLISASRPLLLLRQRSVALGSLWELQLFALDLLAPPVSLGLDLLGLLSISPVCSRSPRAASGSWSRSPRFALDLARLFVSPVTFSALLDCLCTARHRRWFSVLPRPSRSTGPY